MTEGYRGYSVRKEYGCAPNKPKRFQCSTIQEEAANTIQYFWRKWKGKSLFQQLLLYRADKQQQLTYFCQQVRTFTFQQFDPLEISGGSRDTGYRYIDVVKELKRHLVISQNFQCFGHRILYLLLRRWPFKINRHTLLIMVPFGVRGIVRFPFRSRGHASEILALSKVFPLKRHFNCNERRSLRGKCLAFIQSCH